MDDLKYKMPIYIYMGGGGGGKGVIQYHAMLGEGIGIMWIAINPIYTVWFGSYLGLP